MMVRIGVTTTLSDPTEARQLAQELNLNFIENRKSEAIFDYDYILVLTPDYLGLQETRDKKWHPFYIDFLAGKMRYRAKEASRGNELIAHAIGMKQDSSSLIVDATAGLGRDSFILATLGFRLVMLEKSPILYHLLQNALQRARLQNDIKPIIGRLDLRHADALTWIKQTDLQPDVIYLDPMFPPRKKAASVKKEMVILHNLLGTDDNSEELLLAALACAIKRVVVKRSKLSGHLAKQHPSFSLMGKSSRFDIYLR